MTIKQKQPLRLRHELKYSISSGEALVLAARLHQLFPYDKNADETGVYTVSSLYFDTPYDKALRQKIHGVNQREKFRLRYYGENPTFLRLEKKMKLNGLCAKESISLTEEQGQLLLAGKPDFLLEREEPLALEFYSKIRGQCLAAKSIVQYDRQAFCYAPGNVRLTLDRRIRTSLHCTDFFTASRAHMDVSQQQCVFEVKYDGFLPRIVGVAVQLENHQASAYSKYAVCRKFE